MLHARTTSKTIVHYRIGSLEKHAGLQQRNLRVHYRIGSLEIPH